MLSRVLVIPGAIDHRTEMRLNRVLCRGNAKATVPGAPEDPAQYDLNDPCAATFRRHRDELGIPGWQ